LIAKESGKECEEKEFVFVRKLRSSWFARAGHLIDFVTAHQEPNLTTYRIAIPCSAVEKSDPMLMT